jgi:hypothetical protein
VRRSVLSTAVLAIVLAGGFGLAACGGSDSKADDRNVTVDGSDDPTVSYGSDDLPDDFPSEVPLPDDLSLSDSTTAGDFFRLAYSLGSTSPGDAVDAYESELDSAGFDVETISAPGASEDHPSPLHADGEGWRVVAVATDDGGGSLDLTVTRS